MTDSPRTLVEVLDDLSCIFPEKTARRLEGHREFAIRALERLMAEATTILEGLRSEDADAWLYAARQAADHAGYSNSLASNSGEAVAQAGMITGIVEAIA